MKTQPQPQPSINERKTTDSARFTTVIGKIVGKRLMYKDLIGDANAPNLP